MLDWETWVQTHTENRVILADTLDMGGSYCYQISSDVSLSSTWQSSIIANTNATNVSNFKIRALVRKNTNSGSIYLFGRANKTSKQAYILELRDSLFLYKGVLGEYYTGSYLVSTGDYIFPKNATYHLELAFHTGVDNKTFVQVKFGDMQVSESWTTVFSVITENENLPSGYWGFGVGTYTRREQFYFDNVQYFLEY